MSSIFSLGLCAIIGMSLLIIAASPEAQAKGFDEAEKLPLNVRPSSDGTLHVMVADARQMADQILVKVRVVRRGARSHRVRMLRLTVMNSRGGAEKSINYRLSSHALASPGGGYQWLAMSLPHRLEGGQKLQLGIDPGPSS